MKPNPKLAAIKIGDALKYDTTINSINRIASAVFSFSKESFPVEGITSERARLIYDWIMTLFKQKNSDNEKLEYLQAFLGNIAPPEKRQELNQILRECGIHAQLVAPPVNQEDDFLSREFIIPSLHKLPIETQVADIIHSRLEEVSNTLKSEAYLATIILCGSILEGVLLGAAQKYPEKFNRSSVSPKTTDGKVKPFHEWSLAQFIDVAYDIRLIELDVKKFSHALRDFRNFIHPYQQMLSNFTPDKHTAKICFQVLKAALADLAGER